MGWRERDLADVVATVLDRRYACPAVPPRPPAAADSGAGAGESTTLTGRVLEKVARAPVPIEIANGLILFQARINDRPVTVLLDNGATTTLIDTGFARRVGLNPGDGPGIV